MDDKGSIVWKYVKGGKCQVKIEDRICNDPVSQTKSSNVWRHFKRCHKILHDQLKAQAKDGDPTQPKISSFVAPNSGPLKDLALFFATSTTPMSVLKNERFQKVICRIPDFKIPSREKLSQDIDSILKRFLTSKMTELKGRPFSLCLDISTTKSMQSSFLGVTVHYFDKYFRIVSFALAIEQLEDRHTYDLIQRVSEKVLNKYHFNLSDVEAFVTDNGSNMLKAFKFFHEDESRIEEGSDLAILDNALSEENSSVSTDSDEEEEEEKLIIPKCCRCIAHILQLVLQDVFEKNVAMKALKKKVLALLNSFKHSHQAVSMLKKSANKSLITPVKTRWSSLVVAYGRILEVFDEVMEICDLCKWEPLSNDDRILMKSVVDILLPFKEISTRLQSSTYPTISMVYPGIRALICALEEMDDTYEVPNLLIKSITGKLSSKKGKPLKRFEHVVDLEATEFDARFIVSTALDPYTCFMLTESAEEIFPFIKKVSNVKTAQRDELAPSPAKRPRSLFSFGSSTQLETQATNYDRTDLLFAEFKKYFESVRIEQTKTSEFWLENKNTYPKIYEIAQKLLFIPATSASVERLFSFLTLHTSGNKCNSKARLIEQKVLCSFNDKFF